MNDAEKPVETTEAVPESMADVTQPEKEAADDDDIEAQLLADLEADEAAQKTAGALNPDDFGTQIEEPLADMSINFGGVIMNETQASEPAHAPSQAPASAPVQIPPVQTLPAQTPASISNPPGLIKIYCVKQVDTLDSQPQGEPIVHEGKFSDRDEANEYATSIVSSYRLQHGEPRSITEEHKYHLYHCTLTHDTHKSTQIYVSSTTEPISNYANIDPSTITLHLPSLAYFVRFELSTPDGKTIDRQQSGHYTDLKLANDAACKFLYEYLQPKRGQERIEWLEIHENMIGAMLREGRDGMTENGNMFNCALAKVGGGEG